jgi:rRNA-processing protein FCF1
MPESRKIVLDANILVRAVLGKVVYSILECGDENCEFYIPSTCIDEAKFHLPHFLKDMKDFWMVRTTPPGLR